MADLTYRLVSEGELDRVAAFSRKAAGVDIPASYWRWRYFDNPAGHSGIVVALDGDQIVGLMSAFAVTFRFGGKRVLASQMGNNDVLAPYRSAKVFFQLATAVFRELLDNRGFDFFFGVAIRETRDLSVVFMGFEEVGPIAKLVKIVNPVPHVRKASRLPLPRSLGKPLAIRTRRAAYRELGGLTVSRFEHFEEVVDDGWEEVHARHLLASRDAGTMEWRYVRCPLEGYGKLQLRSGGDLLGWVVYHTFVERGVRYGVVDECIATREGAIGPLADGAIAGVLEHDVDAIVAWASPSTELYRALKSRGFLRRPSPRSLIVRPSSDGVPMPVLSSESTWYYTVGDSDYWLFPVLSRGEGA